MLTRKLTAYVRGNWVRLRSGVAMVGALTAFTVAGFLWHTIAGLVVLGTSLMVADYLAD